MVRELDDLAGGLIALSANGVFETYVLLPYKNQNFLEVLNIIHAIESLRRNIQALIRMRLNGEADRLLADVQEGTNVHLEFWRKIYLDSFVKCVGRRPNTLESQCVIRPCMEALAEGCALQTAFKKIPAAV